VRYDGMSSEPVCGVCPRAAAVPIKKKGAAAHGVDGARRRRVLAGRYPRM
jgi:hypothetical protein